MPPPEDEPVAPSTGARQGFASLLRRDMLAIEQIVVYAAALAALVIGLALSVPALLTHHRGGGSPALYLLVTTVVFVILAGAARYGRRTIASIACLLAAFGMGTVIGFGYIAVGAWLMFRSSRAQRLERSGLAASGTTTRAATPARSRRRREPSPSAGNRAPNKRYTPPAGRARKR